MPTENDEDEEIRRRFEEILAGMSTDEAQGAISDLLATGSGGDPFRNAPARPDLRRPQLEAPVVLTVRVDLRQASPPIWRRVELRSDLSLATVHQILQTAFDRVQLCHEYAAREHCPGAVIVRAAQFHDFVGSQPRRVDDHDEVMDVPCQRVDTRAVAKLLIAQAAAAELARLS